MDKAKPFCISKREVWTAYKRVKENGGAAGVDDQTIGEFEKDLSNNLYRLWNRMSSWQLPAAASPTGRHPERRWWNEAVGYPYGF
jgi:retron-type reverse transcriptase